MGAERRPELLAVVNPVAGGCDADAVCEALAQACQTAGLRLRTHRTAPGDDVPERVRKALAEGCVRVVAAGGDGTVCAVASAVLGGDVPLAIVPVGTANVLARELGIPLDLEGACRLAASGMERRLLDAMQIGERVYLCRVSLGVYSEIAASTSAAAKRAFRQVAYVWSALRRLFQRRSWHFELETDGVRTSARASFVVVANVGGIGAGDLRWGEDVTPDDGALDVFVVRARSPWDYAVLFWHVLRRRQREARDVSVLRARQRVWIRAGRRVPVRGDGEALASSQVEIRVRAGCIPVVCPASAASLGGGGSEAPAGAAEPA